MGIHPLGKRGFQSHNVPRCQTGVPHLGYSPRDHREATIGDALVETEIGGGCR